MGQPSRLPNVTRLSGIDYMTARVRALTIAYWELVDSGANLIAQRRAHDALLSEMQAAGIDYADRANAARLARELLQQTEFEWGD